MIKNLQAVADVTKTDRSVVYELTVSGKLKGYKTTAARMHMLLSFVQDIDGQKKKQRYYPMFVECTMTKEGDCKFIGTSKVELAYVFADKKDCSLIGMCRFHFVMWIRICSGRK